MFTNNFIHRHIPSPPYRQLTFKLPSKNHEGTILATKGYYKVTLRVCRPGTVIFRGKAPKRWPPLDVTSTVSERPKGPEGSVYLGFSWRPPLKDPGFLLLLSKMWNLGSKAFDQHCVQERPSYF